MDQYMNELDITYYESLIDQIQEERKIHEMLNIFEHSHLIEGFDREQIAIYEGKIIESIVNVIKSIIDKALTFVRKIISFFTKKKDAPSSGSTQSGTSKIDTLVPDKRLIMLCEEKLKRITEEEKRAFIIKEIDISGSVLDVLKDLKPHLTYANDKLFDLDDKLADYVKNPEKDPNISNFSSIDSEIDKKKADLDSYTIDGLTKKDVKFDEIKFHLSMYMKDNTLSTSSLYESSKNVEKKFENYRKNIDELIKIAESDNKLDSKIINSFKNSIAKCVACIVSILKKETSFILAEFKNHEVILRKFVAFKSETTSNESVEYFDRLLESILYEESEEGVIL